MNSDSKKKLCLSLIVLLALGLRLWGCGWGLPYQYQTEEYKVIKYALRMGSGDLNPHFFEYPSLYLYGMLFVYGIYFLLGKMFGLFSNTQDFAHLFVRDPTSFYLIGRILESLFNVGIILLTYEAGKKLFSKKVGLVAALFLAVLPISVNTSHATKGDMAAVFLGILFWICAYKIYETGEKKYYCLSAIMLGLAISVKYYMAMMGIVFPLAHFLSPNRVRLKYFLISLILIPLFFVMGTPYSILSQREFLKTFQEQKNIFTTFTGKKTSYAERFLTATKNYIKMNDLGRTFMIGSYGVGILSFLGLVTLSGKWRRERLLLLTPIFSYWLVVALYHNPAAGYLAPTFPILAICAAHFVCDFIFPLTFSLSGKENKLKIFVRLMLFLFFIVSIISPLGESLKLSYSYTLQDTRTVAKEWIEINIPSKSKILIDATVTCPPLEMTEQQLRKFYEIAVQLNHYKKDYFKLKLEVFMPAAASYELYVIKRLASEIGSLPYQVDEVQKVQDTVEVNGDANDIEKIRKLGIRYVITDNWSENNALLNMPRIAGFHQILSARSKLIKTFAPHSSLHPGPIINIYKLSSSPDPLKR